MLLLGSKFFYFLLILLSIDYFLFIYDPMGQAVSRIIIAQWKSTRSEFDVLKTLHGITVG